MKSILITVILSILMSLAPAVEHGTDSSTSIESAKQSVESHASMVHEVADNECCHDNCICCVSSSCAIPPTLETTKDVVNFVINFNTPSTNSPHLAIYLRPPILS